MAAFVFCLVLFLAMTGHSIAPYCLCRDGVSESALQTNIDYACGSLADCSPIRQNGVCYNPNTVRDHCNYAVNSYFQRSGQVPGSCNFTGSATQSQNPPSGQTSTCVYPSTPSNPGTPGTPSTPPSTPAPPGTPSTPPSTPAPPGTPSTTPGTPGSTPGTFPGTNTPPGFGISPSGFTPDNSASVNLHKSTNLFCSFTLTLLFSGLLYLRV